MRVYRALLFCSLLEFVMLGYFVIIYRARDPHIRHSILRTRASRMPKNPLSSARLPRLAFLWLVGVCGAEIFCRYISSASSSHTPKYAAVSRSSYA